MNSLPLLNTAYPDSVDGSLFAAVHELGHALVAFHHGNLHCVNLEEAWASNVTDADLLTCAGPAATWMIYETIHAGQHDYIPEAWERSLAFVEEHRTDIERMAPILAFYERMTAEDFYLELTDDMPTAEISAHSWSEEQIHFYKNRV